MADGVMNSKDALKPSEAGPRDARIITAIYEAAPSGKTIKL